MEKERVDVLAVKQGLFETREQAKRSVMAGLIYNEKNERFDKPGEKIPVSSELRVKGKKLPYVSRGGLKLEKALKAFDLSVEGKTLLDIGASTGGFTDAALQNGAKMSYALDVGYNQLAWKIRQDPRVVVMERVNFRYAKPEDFTLGIPEVAVIDVSFISLTKILPAVYRILNTGGEVVALIKPQFEAGREKVGKKGVVRDPKVHEEVIEKICDFASTNGFELLHLDYSPIKGPEGNIEYLLHMRKTETMENGHTMTDQIKEVVDASHADLAKNKE